MMAGQYMGFWARHFMLLLHFPALAGESGFLANVQARSLEGLAHKTLRNFPRTHIGTSEFLSNQWIGDVLVQF